MHNDGEVLEVLRARRFTLVNEGGEEIAALTAINDLPSFSLSDAAGQMRVQLSVDVSGEIALRLYDDRQQVRVRVGLPTGGRGELYVYDADGTVLWRAP